MGPCSYKKQDILEWKKEKEQQIISMIKVSTQYFNKIYWEAPADSEF